MGRREAEEDGIEYYYDRKKPCRGSYGSYIYSIPCQKCGKIIHSISYGRKQEYICRECRDEDKREITAMEDNMMDYLYTKAEQRHIERFNKAVSKIKRQVKNADKYSDAISVAWKCKDKYDSIPEAMAAIELIYLGYSIIPQQPVGKHRIDFYLPKEKIAFEVDGTLYHRSTDPYLDGRDLMIKRVFGQDTKVVHVPAETIAKNIKMVKKIMKEVTQTDWQPSI